MLQDPVLLNEWHPVGSLSQLETENPLGIRLLGEDVVVWRSDQTVLAWQDLCVHRGTKLSLGKVVDGTIECPYHGWVYDTSGRCIRIPAHPEQTPPAKATVKQYHAKVAYDLVWVCLGTPLRDVPEFPEWHDPSYRKLLCGPYPVNASGPRVIENFLDVAHFPFVHEGILGVREKPEISDYSVNADNDGVVATNVRVYQPDPYGTGVGDYVEYTYKVLRPFTAYLAKESSGPRFSLILMVTPHEPTRSTAWMWMAMNYGHDIPAEKLIGWQNSIFAQDRPIVESQRPELLPLDLQAELHLRSDRIAIAYRKWLRQLGLSFGTS